VGAQSKTAKIELTNTSAGTSVTLGQMTVSDGFVIASNACPTVMLAGSSCAIEVAFAPTVKGKQEGKLQVNSNAELAMIVKLKGKGVAPKLTIDPKSLNFGTQSSGSVSAAENIKLTDDSPAPISFSSAPAATPPFNVTANTCDTLAANGGTCTISVEFAPNKSGKYNGTLELQDSAAKSPQHLKLTGSSN